MTHQAYKFVAEVGDDSQLQLKLPLPPGTRVEVVVLARPEDEFADLRQAASLTTGFWDNSDDDAAWNNT